MRRRLYDYVVAQPDAVGREAAAVGAGVAVHTARFHLDRLVEEGLLEAGFQRLTGRTGPGAGRPAKVYRRTAGEVSVSVPPRGYDLVGQVFAAAIQRSLEGDPLSQALSEEAHGAGRRDGADLGPAGERSELDRASEVLARRGYEPIRDGDDVTLRNCPFDALVREHPELVCRVNHDYVDGVLEGLGCVHTCAHLDPVPGRCCVRVSREQ